jgi:hypothetical protein
MKDNQNNKTGGTQQSTYALEKTRNLNLKQASDNEFCKGSVHMYPHHFSLYFAANMYLPTLKLHYHV